MVEVAILAGGWGKRLGPITSRRPKPLIPLAGKRIMDYTIEQASRVRPEKGVIVLHPKALPIDGLPEWLAPVPQRAPRLTGALREALPMLEGGEVVISFTGYLTHPGDIVEKTLDYYSSSGYPVVVAVAPATGLETYGFVRLGISNRVEGLTEQLEEWKKARGYVFAGVLVGERKQLDLLATKGFIEGLNSLASKGLVGAYIWQGSWLEIAYPWDLLKAIDVILAGRASAIHPRASISGSAKIGRGVIIDEGAIVGEYSVIRGPAYIGRGAIVEDHAVVGPGVLVEEGSRVSTMAVVRNSLIMENVVIGHASRITGSIVSESTRIASYTVAEEADFREYPEWIRKLVEGPPELLGVLKIGAVFSPGTHTRPFSYVEPGMIV